jgi:hypothetical protein
VPELNEGRGPEQCVSRWGQNSLVREIFVVEKKMTTIHQHKSSAFFENLTGVYLSVHHNEKDPANLFIHVTPTALIRGTGMADPPAQNFGSNYLSTLMTYRRSAFRQPLLTCLQNLGAPYE